MELKLVNSLINSDNSNIDSSDSGSSNSNRSNSDSSKGPEQLLKSSCPSVGWLVGPLVRLPFCSPQSRSDTQPGNEQN